MTAPLATIAPVHTEAILVIDDEAQIRRAVGSALQPLCNSVLEAASGAEGIDIAANLSPGLIVLDLGLPDMAGITVCQEVRRWSSIPIVVLSARHAEREKIDLLTAGADDYVTKPFSLAELVARVQAQLRRASLHGHQNWAQVLADGLSIDVPHREVRRDGEVIRLTRIEWLLLHAMVQNAGRTLTHQQLFDAVWARTYGNPQQYLRVHVTNLRRKIERKPATPRLIVTDPGVGYRFEVPDE
jgi:two-component system, OmpR family, KDP operon response regulator KdpE